MKDFILYFLLIILVGEVVTLYIMHSSKTQENVLAVATVQTPFPSPSPTETPGPSPKITPRPIPTATPIPQPTFSSRQINGFIDRFASQYNVSPDILRHIAICESGFNPLARNLAYGGLYQFAQTTWRNLRIKMGEDPNVNLRFNAEEAVQTAAYVLHINDAGIWPHCVP